MTEETGMPKRAWKERWNRFWGGKWQYFVVLAFGLILSVGVWGFLDRTMTGDDYAFHVTRLQSVSKGWANGQIVPQVDPDALNGFGYAYNIFYGPLLGYLAAGLQALISNWAIVINIVLVICLVVSGLWMCYVIQRISGNRVLAALIGVIYMVAPYHLTDLYSRMALGEVAALMVAPVVILGLYQLTTHEKHAARSLAVGAALLILTHSLSAVLIAVMSGIYVILNFRRIFNWESIWRMVLAVVVALGLTAFFWLPLVEVKMVGIYGVFNEGYLTEYFGANGQSLNDHRVGPEKLLVTDSYSGACDLAVGIIALVGLIGFLLVRKRIENKDQRRFVTSLYIIAILAIVGMSSVINWHYVPQMLKQIQFPWRMMEIFTIAMSVVSGYTIFGLMKGLAEEKQRILVVVAGVIALYPMIPTFMPREEKHLAVGDTTWSEVGSASLGWQAEYAPMPLLCSPDNAEEVAQGYACSLTKIEDVLDERGSTIEVVSGRPRVSKVHKDGLNLEFDVTNTGGEAIVELPMIYYPGYEAKYNDEMIKVSYSERLGLVTVTIPSGTKGRVVVSYGLSSATKIGVMISVVTTVLGLVWVVISGIRDARARKKQNEVDRLMDSVRQVMEENEKQGVVEAEIESGPKKTTKTRRKNTAKVDKIEGADGAQKNKKAEKVSQAKVTAEESKTTTKAKTTKIKAKSASRVEEESQSTKSTKSKTATKTTRIKAGKKEDKA